MLPIEHKRRWLEPNESPTMNFVVMMPDGNIGQATSAFFLMDLIFHEHYTDCEEIETWWYIAMDKLRDIAVQYAMENTRVSVYSALGAFYDSGISRYPDEIREEQGLQFNNPNDPIIFDGWDAWTATASLIRCGYIRVWEKIPTFSESFKERGCDKCVYKIEKGGESYCSAWESFDALKEWKNVCWWVTNQQPYDNYREVEPDKIMTDLTFQPRWKPVDQRGEEYVGYRVENLKRAKENEHGQPDTD